MPTIIRETFWRFFHLHVKRVRPTEKYFFPASLTQYSCVARALALQQSLIVMTTIIRETLQHGVGIHAVVSIPSICLSSYSHCVEETDLVQPSAAAAPGSQRRRGDGDAAIAAAPCAGYTRLQRLKSVTFFHIISSCHHSSLSNLHGCQSIQEDWEMMQWTLPAQNRAFIRSLLYQRKALKKVTR